MNKNTRRLRFAGSGRITCSEDRRSFDNLLILCPNHHKVTDNEAEYPVERLRWLKKEISPPGLSRLF